MDAAATRSWRPPSSRRNQPGPCTPHNTWEDRFGSIRPGGRVDADDGRTRYGPHGWNFGGVGGSRQTEAPTSNRDLQLESDSRFKKATTEFKHRVGSTSRRRPTVSARRPRRTTLSHRDSESADTRWSPGPVPRTQRQLQLAFANRGVRTSVPDGGQRPLDLRARPIRALR